MCVFDHFVPRAPRVSSVCFFGGSSFDVFGLRGIMERAFRRAKFNFRRFDGLSVCWFIPKSMPILREHL